MLSSGLFTAASGLLSAKFSPLAQTFTYSTVFVVCRVGFKPIWPISSNRAPRY